MAEQRRQDGSCTRHADERAVGRSGWASESTRLCSKFSLVLPACSFFEVIPAKVLDAIAETDSETQASVFDLDAYESDDYNDEFVNSQDRQTVLFRMPK